MKAFPVIRYGPNPAGRMPAVLVPRVAGGVGGGRGAGRVTGLGDLVAVVAEPVKRMLMRVGPGWVRRALSSCDCDRRRRVLNRVVPFGRVRGGRS